MPRLDGTGPQGKGLRTGRGMGNCRGFVGRFCRWCPFFNNDKILDKEDQKKILLEEKESIEKELADLDK